MLAGSSQIQGARFQGVPDAAREGFNVYFETQFQGNRRGNHGLDRFVEAQRVTPKGFAAKGVETEYVPALDGHPTGVGIDGSIPAEWTDTCRAGPRRHTEREQKRDDQQKRDPQLCPHGASLVGSYRPADTTSAPRNTNHRFRFKLAVTRVFLPVRPSSACGMISAGGLSESSARGRRVLGWTPDGQLPFTLRG